MEPVQGRRVMSDDVWRECFGSNAPQYMNEGFAGDRRPPA
jgi:hypothetical protein